jgi:hypothetical protein
MGSRNGAGALVLAAALLAACSGGSVGPGGGTTGPEDLSGLIHKFSLPPQDADGWSILAPSSDSRLVYVAADGDDGTGEAYAPSSPLVGADPFLPAGAVRAYATLAAALAQARAGFPDWILLRRGDTWTSTAVLSLKAGRSATERSLLGAYGPATVRPVVKDHGITLSWASDAAVVGIRFYAARRDPTNAAEFAGFASAGFDSGFDGLLGYGGSLTGGILIEDCWFDWFAGNVLQSPKDSFPPLTDLIVRRNLITNDYSPTDAHSQGLYTDRVSLLLEENVFDHNGWFQPAAGNDGTDGGATMFNHNTYFAGARDTLFRRNLFLRASSIGNKFTSNTDSGTNQVKAWNILVDDNLYVEGEIGISMGGNDDQDDGPRWRNIQVTDNVMMHLGRAQPTERTLGWGIEVDDWEGGVVSGNVFTHIGDPVVDNTFAIVVSGDTSDLAVAGNVVHAIESGGNALVDFRDGDRNHRTRFTGNALDADSTPLLGYALSGNAGFGDNHFSSSRPQAQWFRVAGAAAGLDAYRTASKDGSSVAAVPSYADPERTLETYLASLGLPTDLDSYAAALRQQSRFHWDPALQAPAINAYVRAGFAH